jgi:hypothetical protein
MDSIIRIGIAECEIRSWSRVNLSYVVVEIKKEFLEFFVLIRDEF